MTDSKFIVTTTEFVVREVEVWAGSVLEAATYADDRLGANDGVVVDRVCDIARVEDSGEVR